MTNELSITLHDEPETQAASHPLTLVHGSSLCAVVASPVGALRWPVACGSSPALWGGCGRCLSRGRLGASLPPHRSSSMSASLAAAPQGSTPPTG